MDFSNCACQSACCQAKFSNLVAGPEDGDKMPFAVSLEAAFHVFHAYMIMLADTSAHWLQDRVGLAIESLLLASGGMLCGM
jgi:hypothetical protein